MFYILCEWEAVSLKNLRELFKWNTVATFGFSHCLRQVFPVGMDLTPVLLVPQSSFLNRTFLHLYTEFLSNRGIMCLMCFVSGICGHLFLPFLSIFGSLDAGVYINKSIWIQKQDILTEFVFSLLCLKSIWIWINTFNVCYNLSKEVMSQLWF